MSDFLYSLVNMSIAGSFIAAVIILLRIPLKKAPRKYSYMLWSILGIRLLCPFSFSSVISLFNLFRTETDGGRMSFEATQNFAAPAAGTIPAAPVTPGIPGTAHGLPQAAEQTQAADFLPYILFAIWAVGAAALAIYNLVALAQIKKRVSDAVNIGENIYESASISNAFVLGIFRPKIYIPTALSEKERCFIISHEQTHIRRFDCVIKPVALIALCVHWFNPLMWLSFFLMTRDMEISCDERVVRGFDAESRKDYALALLNMSVRQNRCFSGGILAFGESSIKQRIKNVLSPGKPTLWITISAAAVIIIAAVCLLTNSENNKPEQENDLQKTINDNAGLQTLDLQNPNNSRTESDPDSGVDSAANLGSGGAPKLTPENANAAVRELLNSFILTKDGDEIVAVFTIPEQLPIDPNDRTRLEVTLNADYSKGEGTFASKNFLEDETGLKNGKTYRYTLGNQLSSSECLQAVMLRAAYMTEVGENAFNTYYADYISMTDPFVFDTNPNAKELGITHSGNEYSLNYNLAYDSFGVKFTLPDGMTVDIADTDENGSYTAAITKGSEEIGTINIYGLGTTDKETLESIDPASEDIPMPIYSPVALSNMIDFHSSYSVLRNAATGSTAVCYPDQNGKVVAKCVMMFDYNVTPYFIMISFEPESIFDADLLKLAESVSFIS